MPPMPPSEVEISAAAMNRLSVEGAENSDDSPRGAKGEAGDGEVGGSDSDRESDYEANDKEGDDEQGEDVRNCLYLFSYWHLPVMLLAAGMAFGSVIYLECVNFHGGFSRMPENRYF